MNHQKSLWKTQTWPGVCTSLGRKEGIHPKMTANWIISLCSVCVIIIVVLTAFFSITHSASSQSSEQTAKWDGIPAPCLCQEFRCAGGTFCLHKSKVCSGYRDCPDGEDELPERCDEARGKTPKVKCRKDQFKCKFGGCIKLSQVCDKEINCWGGVDEASDFCSWVKS